MMKKIKSFKSFINEDYKLNNITEQDIVDCIKSGGVIYSDIVSTHPDNKNWEKEPLTPFDIEDGKIGVKIDGNPHYVKLENIKRVEWSKEKRISELFDSEELKNMQEIDYLNGNLDRKALSATELKKLTPIDQLFSKLMWEAPFLSELSPYEGGKDLYLKKSETINFSETDIVTFIIEVIITVNKIDDYVLSYKIETIGNGQSIFKRLEHFGIMNYQELLSTINDNLLDDVIQWNKESFGVFKKTPMKNATKRLMRFNYKNN